MNEASFYNINNYSQLINTHIDIMNPFEGMKKKRFFKLGFVGMLCTTGVSIGMLAYIYYVMYYGWKQSGLGIDEKLAQEIFEEDNEYFGRKSRSSKRTKKVNQVNQINEQLLAATNIKHIEQKQTNKKTDYI